MGEGEDQGRRVGLGEVDQVRSWGGMGEVEGEEVGGGEGTGGVGVGEDWAALEKGVSRRSVI